jgi:phosphodiesterase/alkaline phosphatase D-like protein
MEPNDRIYDDHEIENDWVKESNDPLYLEAMQYYKAFFGIRNPPSPVVGEHYYNFSVGRSSFFILDAVGLHATDPQLQFNI